MKRLFLMLALIPMIASCGGGGGGGGSSIDSGCVVSGTITGDETYSCPSQTVEILAGTIVADGASLTIICDELIVAEDFTVEGEMNVN